MTYNLGSTWLSTIVQRHLAEHNQNLQQSYDRLSSGQQINHASDDAAGFQISERLRTQIAAYEQASKNTTDGNSVLGVIDGSLETIEDSIQRMRELTVQAATATYSVQQKQHIRQEIDALLDHIDQISRSTRYNNIPLLTATAPTSYFIQIGLNNLSNVDRVNLAGSVIGDFTTSGTLLLRNLAFSINTNTSATTFLTRIDAAMNLLHQRRANLGAFQNRFEKTVLNIDSKLEALKSSDSAIRDADIAKETTLQSRASILQQAAISMLTQANQQTEVALQLLR